MDIKDLHIDIGAIYQVGRGVPSLVLGVSARYVHSHVPIINIDDYQATLDLLLRLIPRLDSATVDNLV
jgi:endoglucanase